MDTIKLPQKKKWDIAKMRKLAKEIGELTAKERREGKFNVRDFEEVFEERILRDMQE